MVAVVFLHLVRVFLTGAYKNGTAVNQNRQLNWIIGVVLLLFTLLLSFTGYLLPWDQLAYWAITVGTNIASSAPIVGEPMRFVLLGGHTIDQGTLIRFYVLHCFFLPMGVLLLFSSLDQKKENIAPIKSKTYSLLGITSGRTVHVETSIVDEDKHTVASSPNLTRRLLLVTLGTLAVVALLTIFFHAPLEEAANPSVTPNPAKAPWYFLWLQELVTDTTFTIAGITINGALIGGIILPGILVVAAILWPYLDRSPVRAVGVWLATERRKQNIIFLMIVAGILILTIVGTFLRGPYWNWYWPWQSWPTMPRKF
jgi:cytochrome b-561